MREGPIGPNVGTPPVDGTTLPPYRTGRRQLEVLFELRTRTPTSGFDGIDVRFRWGGADHLVRVPSHFDFCPGGTCS